MKGAESAQKRNRSLTGTSQTTNVSRRLNTRDSLDRINESEFYCDNRGYSNDKYVATIQNIQTVMIQFIESLNQNSIVITGATQTTDMSPHFSRVFVISGS